MALSIVDPATEVRPRDLAQESSFARAIEFLAAALMVAAFWSIQALIGGTRFLFALPAYGLLAVAGVICIGLPKG